MILVQSRKGSGMVSKFNELDMHESLGETLELSFHAFNVPQNKGYQYLIGDSLVYFEDYQFRVKQISGTTKGVKIVAISTFYDLGGKRQFEIFGGTKDFNEFATFTFNGTGWTFINEDVTGFYLIPNFGNDSVIKLIKILCATFDCEYRILPNNVVSFKKRQGPSKMFQYRFKANIKAISEEVDMTVIRTAIRGIGAEGTVYTYKSPNVALFGEVWADDVVNEDIDNATEMAEFLKGQIQDYPNLSYNLETIEMLTREIGEKVWLIHEEMNLELECRVLETHRGVVNGVVKPKSVVLGNFQGRNMYDVIVGQQMQITESKNEFRSKIEQTNDHIRLEVEQLNKSIAAVDIKADEIDISVNNRITNEVAAINIRSDQIELKVDKNGRDIATVNVRADSIESTVRTQGETLGNHESRISQNAYQITLKVNSTDFNGNNIVSKINLDSAGVQIYGSKINLYGAVTVLSDISGRLGTITAGDIYGVNIHSANINISQDATIGNNLYLGGTGWGGKSVQFGSGANINYNGTYLELSSAYTRISSNNHEVNSNTTVYGTLNVPYSTNLIGLVRAESSGIGISVSGKTLYVKVNGSTVGTAALT